MDVATRYADPSQTVGWANHSYERPTPLVAGADLEAAIELGEWWSLRPLQAHLHECRENHRPASFALRVVKEWIEAQTGVNFALEFIEARGSSPTHAPPRRQHRIRAIVGASDKFREWLLRRVATRRSR